MEDAKPLPTPMASGLKLSTHGHEPFDNSQLYRLIVGALQYLLITLPELAFSVNKSKPPIVWCDNLSTLLLAANLFLHAQTKHIELDLYSVREKFLCQQVQVKHVPATDQLVDGLTKPVSSHSFPLFRSKLTIASPFNYEFVGRY
uniref:Uncharacterized protein n=1 Tax=Cannabis sativa TaxID=3483 RepID=A0A803PJ65_CANSA